MKYLDITQEDQIKLMQYIKNKSNHTWKQIAKFLKVNRSMIFFYLNGKSKISYETYVNLCFLVGIKPSYKKFVIIKNRTQPIKPIKKLNTKLAEIIGILAGDGHISKLNYEITIVGHIDLDNHYISNYVKSLLENEFGINAKIYSYKPTNSVRCRINSKNLVESLNKKFKLPLGKKKNRLNIPLKIKTNKLLLKYYLRGLFDTDGSIYIHRKKDLVLSIISRDKQFLKSVKTAFQKLGYHVSISGKNLYLYQQDEIIRFFKEIKPKNQKHINRFNQFKAGLDL